MIELVPFQAEFIDLFIGWRGQASAVRHNPLKSMSASEIHEMLKSEGHELSNLKKYESYRWFIQFENQIVGNLSLKNISHMMSYAEIAYGVSENFQGKGIATAAVNLLIEKSFRETSLRKLIAYVHDKNFASCRVLEKNGFQKEGLLREHYIINGNLENEIFYGLLKSDRG